MQFYKLGNKNSQLKTNLIVIYHSGFGDSFIIVFIANYNFVAICKFFYLEL
jgi:hypothetical protein